MKGLVFNFLNGDLEAIAAACAADVADAAQWSTPRQKVTSPWDKPMFVNGNAPEIIQFLNTDFSGGRELAALVEKAGHTALATRLRVFVQNCESSQEAATREHRYTTQRGTLN